MKSNFTSFDHAASYDRIKEVLDSSENNYTVSRRLPDRAELTYTNGFYAYCSSVFVDIRNSSQLPDKYKRPKLAKLYRTYISEVVAVMNGNVDCTEINIVGDGVWGVFDTPNKRDINYLLDTIAKINSTLKLINYQLNKHDYESIEIGIGAAYGRILVVKAGLSGSGVSDIVYMGDAINHAAKLAAVGNESYFDKTIMLDETFYNNLNDNYNKFFVYHSTRGAYHGDIIDIDMEAWYDANCT